MPLQGGHERQRIITEKESAAGQAPRHRVLAKEKYNTAYRVRLSGPSYRFHCPRCKRSVKGHVLGDSPSEARKQRAMICHYRHIHTDYDILRPTRQGSISELKEGKTHEAIELLKNDGLLPESYKVQKPQARVSAQVSNTKLKKKRKKKHRQKREKIKAHYERRWSVFLRKHAHAVADHSQRRDSV